MDDYTEIGLENVQASKANWRKDDELPTREEVEELLDAAIGNAMDDLHARGGTSFYLVDALIARGWLKVWES